MMNYIVRVFLATLVLVTSIPAISAEEFDDATALEGITNGKVVWDINTNSPKRLALYLNIINETYDGLVKQGVVPDMVITFRGESVAIISSDHEAITLSSMPEILQSAEIINELMRKPNIHMEVCSIAARIFGVDTKHILHGIRPVGNTFISLISYQKKGYAIIPIY